MDTIGVVGMGIIGAVWAKHYKEAGLLAGVWNRTPKREWAGDTLPLADLAEKADILQIVVADPAAVTGVLDQIRPRLRAGKVVVQSSTIDPESAEQFRSDVVATGAEYLEAPFTGSKLAAEQRKSVYYFGGDAAVIARVEKLLTLVSEARFHIGTHRQAAALKLAMNLNIAAQMQALCEALALVRSAGVSDDTFFTAMKKNAGYSGLTALKEPKLRAGDYAPQFSVKHLLKDLRLATRTIGCAEYPLLDTLREQYHHADQKGFGDEDFSAVYKLMEVD